MLLNTMQISDLDNEFAKYAYFENYRIDNLSTR